LALTDAMPRHWCSYVCLDGKSVVNALLRIQLRFGRIDKVCMDKGTNMFEIKILVNTSDGLLQLKELKDQPVDAKYHNCCK